MTDSDNTLLKLIHDTKALAIWNRKTGPVFWYVLGVPGPFYVNTELVIGATLANVLLEKITAIVVNTPDAVTRAKQLNETLMAAYRSSPQYQQVIVAMVAKTQSEFPKGNFDVISGGERRDWLFSIPLAHEMGIRHVFLFKNKDVHCAESLKKGERALHVADLINNAASYFDLWFPLLEKAHLNYIGTLCVNIRGTNGINRLNQHGKKTVTMNNVDLSFFEKSLANGLIDVDTLTEIKTYFASSADWAKRYLMHDIRLFDIQNLDPKSFERLQSFFTKDPWGLKVAHPAFFATMQGEISKRLGSRN